MKNKRTFCVLDERKVRKVRVLDVCPSVCPHVTNKFGTD